MDLRGEGLAFIKTKTDANPNFWTEFADKIRLEGYLWRYDEFFSSNTGSIDAIKDDIVEMISIHSEYDFDPACFIFNFHDYEYEYVFYDREQFDETELRRALVKEWKKRCPGKEINR